MDGVVDGNPSGRAALAIGYDHEQYGRPSPGNVDLSAGVANLKLSSLQVSYQLGNANSPGTLTLGSSGSNHLDVSGSGSPVKIGYLALWGGGNDGGVANGTVTLANLDATSSIVATDNSTAILLGYRGPGVTSSSTGTLNLNGGTLTITTTGTAIGSGGGGTSNLNLDGVTLKAGASSTTWLQGLTSTKIKSGGVTFDTAGNNITVAQPLLTDTVSTGGGLNEIWRRHADPFRPAQLHRRHYHQRRRHVGYREHQRAKHHLRVPAT